MSNCAKSPRRQVLGFLGLAPAVAALPITRLAAAKAAAVPFPPFDDRHPDTRLMKLCADMEAAYQRWSDLLGITCQYVRTPHDLDTIKSEANDLVYALADQIEAIHPLTFVGLQAKARAAIILWSAGEGAAGIDDSDNAAMLARSLVIGLAGTVS